MLHGWMDRLSEDNITFTSVQKNIMKQFSILYVIGSFLMIRLMKTNVSILWNTILFVFLFSFQFSIPQSQWLTAEAGDYFGWFDEANHAIGFDYEGENVACLRGGLPFTEVGSTFNAATLATGGRNRIYGVEICIGKELTFDIHSASITIHPYHSKQVFTLSQWFLNLLPNQAWAPEGLHKGYFTIRGTQCDHWGCKMNVWYFKSYGTKS